MTSIPSPFPTDRQLDDAVAGLAAKEDHPGVIRVVEAWSAQRTPSPRARLAAARAFFELRMMDRATLRVREVLDTNPQDLDATALLVRIFLERGWKERARAPLAELTASGWPGAAALNALAAADFEPPETRARQVERDGNTEQLLLLAERFCATGSFTRAAGILERIRRQEPQNPRAQALLWGVAADLGAGPPLADLLSTPVAPTLQLPDFPEEPEHTESVDATTRARMLAELAEEVADHNFPSLFKGAEVVQEDDDPAERTAVSGMATRDEMKRAGEELEHAQLVNLGGGSGGGDTQILLVLRPGEDIQAHRRREESDRLRETFNLREYQASMGMAPAPDMGDADSLEEEDESVVLLARSEAPAPVTAAAPSAEPIVVVERHPEPLRKPAPPPLEPPPVEPPAAPRASIHPLWVGAVLLVVLLAGIAVLALVLPALLARTRGTARSDLLHALATDDLGVMLRAESDLAARDAPAELAELQVVIWSEFNGDPSRLLAARELLDQGRFDAHRRAVLAADIALAMGDPRGAAAALGREEPQDDEERLLVSRIALGVGAGDPDRANDVLADLDEPGAPRYRLGRAVALAAAGLRGPALALVRDVLAASPSHPRARLLRITLDGPSDERSEAAREYLKDATVPPRFAGAATAVRVQALLEAGVPDRAVTLAREGLQRDGQDVDLHLVVADGLRSSGHLLDALGELDSIATFDERVWVAHVLTLVDLDRVDEADRLVTGRASSSPYLAQTLRAIVAVSAGTMESVPDGEDHPLHAAAAALVAVQSLAPDAGELVAAAAVTPVAPSPGAAFAGALQLRVRALEAELAPAAELDATARELLACCADDPYVHLSLGRAYEQAGRRVLAAQHFDRAVVLGPEVALTWYERGRFYQDAADPASRSAQSWHNYLALAPSGPRARRVGERIATSRLL